MENGQHDPVNHPAHYTSNPSGIECIAVTRCLSFNCGNAVKYLWRAGGKDPNKELEDLGKALWYLNDELANATGSLTVPARDTWRRAVGFFSYHRGRAIEAVCTGQLAVAIEHVQGELQRLESEQQQAVAAPAQPANGRGNGKAVPADRRVSALRSDTKVRGNA